MPIERAVPAIAHRGFQGSGVQGRASWCSAIFWQSALESLATLVLFGTAEPDSMPQAFLMRTGAGGVLVMKLNETVRVDRDDNRNNHAGIVLGALVEFLGKGHDVNAMLAGAGPTGGAGVALPAGIWA